MDNLLYLTSLLLLGVSMCFTPRPNNALAMATGMQLGFRAALPFCTGATVGANISLLLLGFGLGQVFERFPLIYDCLRHAGAVYMLRLAWRLSRPQPALGQDGRQGRRWRRQPAADEQKGAQSGFRRIGFVEAMLLQLVNVKVWITNVVIVSRYVGEGSDAMKKLALAVVLFTFLGGGAMCAWAAGGRFMGCFLTSGGMRRTNYLFALFLVLSVGVLHV